MFPLRTLWRRLVGSGARPERPAPRTRLQCEPLEERATPAVFVVGSTLQVIGTNGNDVIRFRPLNVFFAQVIVNGQVQATYGTSVISQVQVLGLTGNDRLNASQSLDPAILQGGAGNDSLFGSVFTDLILGSAGNDTLTTNGGRDVLIGGVGTDTLFSTGAGAILVGGSTPPNFTVPVLNQIRAIWNQPLAYLQRIFLIQQTGFAAAVIDDNNPNVLNGSSLGLDWFFQGNFDQVNNTNPFEVITPV